MKQFKCSECDNTITTKFLRVGEQAKCNYCGTTTAVPSDAEEVTSIDAKVEGSQRKIKRPVVKLQSESEENRGFRKQGPQDEKRFVALRTIANSFKVIAWLGVGFAVIFALIGLASGSGTTISNPMGHPILLILTLTAIAATHFLIFYAIGESIYLFLAIEENTRKS